MKGFSQEAIDNVKTKLGQAKKIAESYVAKPSPEFISFVYEKLSQEEFTLNGTKVPDGMGAFLNKKATLHVLHTDKKGNES